MRAILRNYNQSPRKVRLVADLVRGEAVEEALWQLDLAEKRAALPIKKVLLSAAANAKENYQLDKTNLYIKQITVGKGSVLLRYRPAARGAVRPIRRRRSHVEIMLAPLGERRAERVRASRGRRSKGVSVK